MANQMDAEPFDISLTVARDDRALAVAGGFAAKRRRSKGQSHLPEPAQPATLGLVFWSAGGDSVIDQEGKITNAPSVVGCPTG